MAKRKKEAQRPKDKSGSGRKRLGICLTKKKGTAEASIYTPYS